MVVTAPADRPLSLRRHLRELKAALDDATLAYQSHLESCGCRGFCLKAGDLQYVLAQAQYQLNMTRFLNEDG